MSLSHITGTASAYVEFKGRPTRLLDLAALGEFEHHVFGLHLATLQSMRSLYTEEEYRRELADLRAAKASGLFGIKGRHGAAYAGTLGGQAYLLGLILSPPGAEAVDAWGLYRQHPADCEDLVNQVLMDSGILSEELVSHADARKARAEKKTHVAGSINQEVPPAPFAQSR